MPLGSPEVKARVRGLMAFVCTPFTPSNHLDLERFREHERPVACIDTYLAAVCDEAERRGYRFDRTKLGRGRVRRRLRVPAGQVAFEWAHLLAKLRRRRPALYRALKRGGPPRVHPLFRVVAGGLAPWERPGGAWRPPVSTATIGPQGGS